MIDTYLVLGLLLIVVILLVMDTQSGYLFFVKPNTSSKKKCKSEPETVFPSVNKYYTGGINRDELSEIDESFVSTSPTELENFRVNVNNVYGGWSGSYWPYYNYYGYGYDPYTYSYTYPYTYPYIYSYPWYYNSLWWW